MERIAINILELVAANTGENPVRRKPTVFLATFVSQELADPNSPANSNALSWYKKNKKKFPLLKID